MEAWVDTPCHTHVTHTSDLVNLSKVIHHAETVKMKERAKDREAKGGGVTSNDVDTEEHNQCYIRSQHILTTNFSHTKLSS